MHTGMRLENLTHVAPASLLSPLLPLLLCSLTTGTPMQPQRPAPTLLRYPVPCTLAPTLLRHRPAVVPMVASMAASMVASMGITAVLAPELT